MHRVISSSDEDQGCVGRHRSKCCSGLGLPPTVAGWQLVRACRQGPRQRIVASILVAVEVVKVYNAEGHLHELDSSDGRCPRRCIGPLVIKHWGSGRTILEVCVCVLLAAV